MHRFQKTGLCISFCFMLICMGCEADNRQQINLSKQIRQEGPGVILEQPDAPKSFLFGFEILSTAQEDARGYQPFMEYLGKATGFLFELRLVSSDLKLVESLGQGKFQFAIMGRTPFLIAHDRYGVVPLALGLNSENKPETRAAFITAAQSPIQSIEALKGKKFAFGGHISSVGHLIPRAILAEYNIQTEDLAAFEWTGSHQNAANAVISGLYDAAAIEEPMARALEKQGIIRILLVSPPYPSICVAANTKVPLETIRRVQEALLAFDPKADHSPMLYHWSNTEMPNGFTQINPDIYNELRELAIRFGLLSPASEQNIP